MMIHLLHAAFVYQAPDGEVEALRDVSLDVEEGEFCSIVGPSGCGKSTLLSALAGLEPLTGGEIAVDGEAVRGPSPRVGFMPQQDQLFPWQTMWFSPIFTQPEKPIRSASPPKISRSAL